MESKASISECGLYRYDLWRVWDLEKPFVLFIGLNPSTADHEINDPTIERCISFAKNWGFGGLCVCNLFAFRATNPEEMQKADDPIGSKNDEILFSHAKKAGKIIAAWGNSGAFLGRSKVIKKQLSCFKIYCLAINQSGEPKHPLYTPADITPVAFA